MAKRLKTSPRKQPQQSRAQGTVDAVLAAAGHLLTTIGYDTLSTNRIALAAGVSIGSLYQYFPSKEAIVAALVDGHCRDMASRSLAALAAHAHSSIEVTAREVVVAMVAAQSINPKLHRALREQVPRVGKLNMVEALHGETTALVTQYLESRREDLKLADPALAAVVVVKTVDALLQNMHELTQSGRTEAQVVDEIVSLVVGYLRRHTR